MRKPLRRTRLGLAALLLLLSAATAQKEPSYLDPELPVAERVDDLLARMTLEEKVGQMTQIDLTRLMGQGEWDRGPLNEDWLEVVLADNHVGSILSGGGAAPVPNTPENWAHTINALQRYALEHSRLGIPLIYAVDAVHGHNNVLGATIFPHNIGLAATWNPGLTRQVERATAADMLATNIRWSFAPVADLGRDPRWGRFYETYGEDPLLASEMVAAAVGGFQGQGFSTGVTATVKHFVGYGQPQRGRDRTLATLPLRALRRLHLPPARAGIAAGAGTVMANSGVVNAVPVHSSRYLLTDVLRGELHFAGPVVSDWNDINKLHEVYHVAASFEDAVRQGIMAGIDIYMVPHDAAGFTKTLLKLVRSGEVPEARIDEAVRRVLKLKFELGLFEHPFTDTANAADIEGAHRDLAYRAAAQSLTLLKNAGHTLPIATRAGRLMVVGPGADSSLYQMGGWTIGWQGAEGAEDQIPAVTVLEGLERAVAGGIEISYTKAWRNLETVREKAAAADWAIVVVGEEPYAEGAGDSVTLALPAAQERLIQDVAATGTPTVVVMLAGRPLILGTETLSEVDALLMAYLPGTETGSAVADALFGSLNPGGRLPFSWPAAVGQLPLTYNYLPGDTYEPVFPFGYGLSYTTFRYGDLRVAVGEGVIDVTVDVANTGSAAGSEVVQAYLGQESAPVMVPVRRLVGFLRVWLEPGETKSVLLHIPLSRLAVIPGDILGSAEPVVVAGRYSLMVGDEHEAFMVEPGPAH